MNYKKALEEKIKKSLKLAEELNENGVNAVVDTKTGEISMTFPENYKTSWTMEEIYRREG